MSIQSALQHVSPDVREEFMHQFSIELARIAQKKRQARQATTPPITPPQSPQPPANNIEDISHLKAELEQLYSS